MWSRITLKKRIAKTSIHKYGFRVPHNRHGRTYIQIQKGTKCSHLLAYVPDDQVSAPVMMIVCLHPIGIQSQAIAQEQGPGKMEFLRDQQSICRTKNNLRSIT